MNKLFAVAAASAIAFAATPALAGPELVTNGDFTAVTGTNTSTRNFEVDGTTATQPGAQNQYGAVTGWTTTASPTSNNPYNLLFHSNVATAAAATASGGTAQAIGEYGGAEYLAALPSNNAGHGNFMALDGDTSYNGLFSTNLTGLTVGSVYNLAFDWASGQIASRSGATTESLDVFVGSLNLAGSANNGSSFSHTYGELSTPSGGATDWRTVNTQFTASGTSQVLSFLARGAPTGLPPVALLDNVSVRAAVPEPSTWAMMLVGFGAVGAGMRKRRRSTLTAAA